MASFYKVKNKTSVPLSLYDVNGDEVQVPPLSTHTVDARFIEFQLPPLAQAEVLGFDYAAALAPTSVQDDEPLDD